MAEKKMTRKEALQWTLDIVADYASDYPENAEMANQVWEVLNKMLAQVSKSRKKSDAPSKTRIQNEGLANQCVAAIAAHGDEPVNSKWLQEHVHGLMSPQKTTAVMKIAIEDGRIVKEKDGKNTVYRLA